MSLFMKLALVAIFIVAFIVSFMIARGLVLESAREGLDKVGSVSTMPVLRGAVE